MSVCMCGLECYCSGGGCFSATDGLLWSDRTTYTQWLTLHAYRVYMALFRRAISGISIICRLLALIIWSIKIKIREKGWISRAFSFLCAWFHSLCDSNLCVLCAHSTFLRIFILSTRTRWFLLPTLLPLTSLRLSEYKCLFLRSRDWTFLTFLSTGG